jgi:hypothetical protein
MKKWVAQFGFVLEGLCAPASLATRSAGRRREWLSHRESPAIEGFGHGIFTAFEAGIGE